MERVYSRKEAAEILGISTKALDSARMRGAISFVQYVPNGNVFFTGKALEEYVQKCTVRSRPCNENLPPIRRTRRRR